MKKFSADLKRENKDYQNKLDVVVQLKEMSGEENSVNLMDVFEIASKKLSVRVKGISKLTTGSVKLIKELNVSKIEYVANKDAKGILEDEIDDLRRLLKDETKISEGAAKEEE